MWVFHTAPEFRESAFRPQLAKGAIKKVVSQHTSNPEIIVSIQSMRKERS